ncbi:MAG: divalent metal cation transporter [Clostridiales bacterium]|nr:divalent metal cation transporter [Clostridiales bacterium]
MNKIWKKLKEIGPGAVVAAAFIGPGTVTTCTVSGASYGYTLLWAMLFSTVFTIILQEMAARLGIAKQMGLGEALRVKYSDKKGVLIFLAILVISAVFIGNVAYETGNVSGSVMGLQAILPESSKVMWALILGVVAFALLFSGSYKYIEKVLTGLVILMSVMFLATAIAVGPNMGELLKGLFVPRVPQMDRAWFYIAGLIGTTVVPYNIYLHASSAAKKWKNPEEDVKTSRLDTILSIGLGGIISMCIIITAAAAFHGTDAQITNGAVMAEQLKPILGEWATVAMGIGLFAAGMSSAITAPLSAAFASSGILGWGEDMKKPRFKIIWIIVLAFGIVATCTMGASPTEIILFAQAANALLLPVTAILLLIVCNDKKFMGKYANKTWNNILGILLLAVLIFIAFRNMTAFVESFSKLIAG